MVPNIIELLSITGPVHLRIPQTLRFKKNGEPKAIIYIENIKII